MVILVGEHEDDGRNANAKVMAAEGQKARKDTWGMNIKYDSLEK